MPIDLVDIYRYPVKGLSGERLDSAELEVDRPIPHDRRFALADGSVPFDPDNPSWMSKSKLVTLLDEERLARLRVRFDPSSELLSIDEDGRPAVEASTAEEDGRARIGGFLSGFLGPEKTVQLLASAHQSFSDTEKEYLSVINLNSVRALERPAGAPVHPLRFRANLYIDGPPAWEELRWPGSDLRVGDARLEVVKPIARCAATGVDPDTAERDLDPPRLLSREFGHANLGVYARVVAAGRIQPAATVEVLAPDTRP